MKEIKPLGKTQVYEDKISIFLAGSIEQGKAEDWQRRIVKEFEENKAIIFFNPRRDDWDSTWKQEITNEKFRKQVEWELDAMTKADIIIFNFVEETLSPISLLELDLWVNTDKKIFVCCPKNFWRKGNVDIVCAKYGKKVLNNLKSLILNLKEDLQGVLR